jgi:midasin (ATPase involved in ribosome maturation)
LFSATMELISVNDNTAHETLLPILHKFMESSTIGEYGARLSLLKILHRYLVLLESNKLAKLHSSIQPYIWNSIRYYSMFQEQVGAKLNSLKAPIEQKLKEFMKISRWNDSNFYALLDSVKKSQKTLNKLIVDFRKVLQTPVSSCLFADVETEDAKKFKYKSTTTDVALYMTEEVLLPPTKNQLENFSQNAARRKRFSKIPKLYTKAKDIASTAFDRDSSMCQNEVEDLNELTGTIIEKVHALQAQFVSLKINGLKKKGFSNLYFF